MTTELPLLNIELNKNLYITDSQEDDNVIFVHDKFVDDNYWNYAYLKQPKLDLQKIREYFVSKNLLSSVYLLDSDKFKEVEEELVGNGFELSYSDAEMVFEGQKPEGGQKFETKEANNPEAEKDFLKVYSDVFVAEGEDVYSGLSDGYLKNIEEYFKKYPKENRWDLVAYTDGKPAGIATVVFNDQYALIMNVAVTPQYRRMGIAKDLSQSCIKKFYGRTIFLGTEKGSIDEAIYKRMGFRTVAVGKCYSESK